MRNVNERMVVALTVLAIRFYLIAFAGKDGLLGSFMNILFVMVCFYFGNGNRTNSES